MLGLFFSPGQTIDHPKAKTTTINEDILRDTAPGANANVTDSFTLHGGWRPSIVTDGRARQRIFFGEGLYVLHGVIGSSARF